MRFITIILIIIFISSCKTKLPVEKINYPDFKFEETGQNKEQIPDNSEPIIIQEFNPPEENLPPQTGEPIATNSDAIRESTIIAQKQDYNGSTVEYNYVQDYIYTVFTAINKITDIQFQPGEKIISPPAAGDTVNFILGQSLSGEGENEKEHIYLKPIYPQRETTLTVNTNRRTYRFKIQSYNYTFMPAVRFRYPIDEMLEVQQASKREAERAQITLAGDIRYFNFSYEIIPHDIHMPTWAPSIVFADADRTYIHFPSARRTAYAPVLFKVNRKKDRELVNYRVVGTYYIVDEVLDHAELILNINGGNVITIKRRKK